MNLNQERTLIDKGLNFQKNHDLKRAEFCYSNVLNHNPTSIDALFNLANLYHQKGQLSRAIKSFEKVLELNPMHTDAAISLSVLYNDVGQYDKARSVFEKADKRVKGSGNNLIEDTHINKKFAAKHLELAELYLTYNRYDESLFEFKKASALNPESLEIRLKVARVYAKKGFVSKAIEELKKLKNENPNFIEARIALGVLYFGNGSVIEAQTEWQKCLVIKSDCKEAKMYLELSKTANEVTL